MEREKKKKYIIFIIIFFFIFNFYLFPFLFKKLAKTTFIYSLKWFFFYVTLFLKIENIKQQLDSAINFNFIFKNKKLFLNHLIKEAFSVY